MCFILGIKTKQATEGHVINEIVLSLGRPMNGVVTGPVVVRGIELTNNLSVPVIFECHNMSQSKISAFGYHFIHN
jgi:hypothetical protein